MKEAAESCVVWEDVDVETFKRFGQYLYTGTYEGANPVELSSASMQVNKNQTTQEEPLGSPGLDASSVTVEPEVIVDQGDFGLSRRKCQNCRKYHCSQKLESTTSDVATKRSNSWTRFLELYPNVPDGRGGPAPTNYSDLDYTETLLSHARLYVLADYNQMPHLQDLTMSKLHQELRNFYPCEDRRSDIIALTDYIFMNTIEKVNEQGGPRELVIKYFSHFVELLAQDEGFQGLTKISDFSMALIKEMMHRLV